MATLQHARQVPPEEKRHESSLRLFGDGQTLIALRDEEPAVIGAGAEGVRIPFEVQWRIKTADSAVHGRVKRLPREGRVRHQVRPGSCVELEPAAIGIPRRPQRCATQPGPAQFCLRWNEHLIVSMDIGFAWYKSSWPGNFRVPRLP